MPTDLPQLPPRPDDSNKGTFGRVLIVAGSRGMSGAAALSGWGALRGGAGLVEVAVPERIQAIVAGMEPSWLTTGLPEDGNGHFDPSSLAMLAERWKSASAVAIGPGWGVTDSTRQLALSLIEQCPAPLIVDADALNAVAGVKTTWGKNLAPRIVTPHPGEFARLIGVDVKTIQSDRQQYAREFARKHGLVVLLKGHKTVITDGDQLVVNETGNPGMATGGTGDVLTGLIAALVAQKMSPFDAARLGAHLHGLAGDIAAEEFSQPGMIASDLARSLGRAWLGLARS
jgi:NAD(P)H-hydrate epimerase